MTRVIKQTLLTEKALCMALMSACLCLFALYIYFVSASVVQVVMRTELNQEITKTSSEISTLESQYIKAQHRVSSDIASLQGFEKTNNKIFIDRSTDSLVLSTGVGQ
jgi:cell division protein FtsL